jgi:hypothetical protein
VPALSRLSAARIVASAQALDSAPWPEGTQVLRIAQDEVLAIPDPGNVQLSDPDAIVEADPGFAGVWWPSAEALEFLSRTCEWELPARRPAFAQGAVAGIPAKIWFEPERVLIIVPAPYAFDFEERFK